MSQIVPIQPIPNQQVQCQLAGQACTFNIYQQAYGLYIDVYVGQALIIAGVIGENLNRIVRSLYLGFVGDLTFWDTQAGPGFDGESPIYTGLGSRFLLVYIEASELPAGEG
jgi:hypothetical protein